MDGDRLTALLTGAEPAACLRWRADRAVDGICPSPAAPDGVPA